MELFTGEKHYLISEKEHKELESETTRFTLRIPTVLFDAVKEEAEKRVGYISANQWIVETILLRLRHGK